MFTLAQVAEKIDGVWHGNASHAIFYLSSLSRASATDVCFFENPLVLTSLQSTNAGVVILREEYREFCPTNCIVVTHPAEAFTQLTHLFPRHLNSEKGIHSSAQIHSSASIGPDVSIGANVYIGPNAVVGRGVVIGANAVIESEVTVGAGTILGSGVVLNTAVIVGQSVRIDSGAVIGAHPFNYEKTQGRWNAGFTCGGVVIGDKSQIGANTVIDRGTLGDTIIAEGVCIDNQVQIAHDVYVGKHTAIIGCAAIGALTQIGSDCVIGGGACVAASLVITDDVIITGMSSVTKSLLRSGIYSSGTFVHEHQTWRRNAARFKRLDDFILRLLAIEKQLES